MALVALPGAPLVPIGPGFTTAQGTYLDSVTTIDATNEAVIYIGRIVTSDGGSHTIDTTGSSSLGWRTTSVTFANAGTTVKVGLAAVLTTAGPPGRAVHASDVITFDVSKSMTGGGGGITGSAWQTHVPDTGSKTIANGDLIAFAVQMTARGGADSVAVTWSNGNVGNQTFITGFVGGTYNLQGGIPNCIISFADGALGYFYSAEVFSTFTTLSWNSGSATKEYGQLYNLPFPIKIYGLYGWVDPDNDFDIVLYSDPLGTPVAERTVSIDASTAAGTLLRRIVVPLPTPYTTTANQNIAVTFKPGASNISIIYRRFANAAHRVTEPYGTSGYGVSRASGAFSNVNSSLDHFYLGLLAGAFDAGGSGIGALQGGSLIR